MSCRKKVTVPAIISKKRKNKKIVCVTAYDATFARLVDEGGADFVLVGDSLGMVVQGHDNTVPVTLEDIIYHCRAVSRGLRRAHLCGDMPFMSYKISPEQALTAATRVLQEGRAESVKLEGGVEMAPTIERLVQSGIPVVGHVGLTPQSVHSLGGFKMQGKNGIDRQRIIEDAKAVAEAGAFCIVLECMPLELAGAITDSLSIPTIGIGAGPLCDGQILVLYDMLGMNEGFTPKFLKQFAGLGGLVRQSVETYAEEVRAGEFPAEAHSTSLTDTDQTAPQLLYSTTNKKAALH